MGYAPLTHPMLAKKLNAFRCYKQFDCYPGGAIGNHKKMVAPPRLMTVTELMMNFADACRSLVPNLSRARVPWRDGEQWDGWDRVSEALFETLVAEPCQYQGLEVGLTNIKPARYGFDTLAADWNAYIGVVGPGESEARFVRFATIDKRFDHILKTDNSGTITMPLVDSVFVFVVKDDDGKRHLFREIDLTL